MDKEMEPTDADLESAARSVTGDQWQEIEGLLEALPAAIGGIRWHGSKANAEGVVQFPYVSYGEVINTLVAKLYDAGLIVPFDWSQWPKSDEFVSAETLVAASVADAMRYLTGSIRADRMMEGTIQMVLEDGRLQACLANIALWRQFDAMMHGPCLRCGGRVVPLVSGLPDVGLFEMAERGEIVLGGCMINLDDQPTPTARCSQCGTES